MNGRMAKKVRKEVNRAVKYNAKEVLQTIVSENLFTRIKYAFKLVFKYKLGERLNGK